ncbi:MAG: hypothetical protein MUP66_01210 [Candidatus Nanohaloarchaeota archaeon QJJ-5]|nr:hypothetical protein [Candidatus Nanohaloarchaeota archaeon QJJ-5]
MDTDFETVFLHAMAEMKDFQDYTDAYEDQLATDEGYQGLLDTVISDMNAAWRQAEQAKDDLDQYIAEQDLSINHGSHETEITTVEDFLHRAPQEELRAYVQDTDDETKELETLLVNADNLAVYNKTYLNALSTIYEHEPTVREHADIESPEQRRKQREPGYQSLQEQIKEEIEKIRGAKDDFTHYEL